MDRIDIRLPEELKEQSLKILKEKGFTFSSAIKNFLKEVVETNGNNLNSAKSINKS